MPRVLKLVVEYDGTAYCGWQVQPNGPSVQAALEEAAHKLTGERVRVIGASRTDAGVHARGQVAALRLAVAAIPADHFALALNSRLPADIAVRASEEAALDFDPRKDVLSKMYCYRLRASPIRPALDRYYRWHVPWPLDRDAMCQAAARFVGTHDFTSFVNAEYLERAKKAEEENRDTVRTLNRCEVRIAGDDIEIEIEGPSFLYNMVRNIVGTIVDVGRGRFRAEDIAAIFAARDRRAAGMGAPPHGLCLEWIRYKPKMPQSCA
ncbi:MAG: tRNA pseudouridine(38-40) synthase TruA [Planctomycetota bacterium]|nr:tRNA pseudouridine(38-40) synthase TruA [Planctomycetota bacterium]